LLAVIFFVPLSFLAAQLGADLPFTFLFPLSWNGSVFFPPCPFSPSPVPPSVPHSTAGDSSLSLGFFGFPLLQRSPILKTREFLLFLFPPRSCFVWPTPLIRSLAYGWFSTKNPQTRVSSRNSVNVLFFSVLLAPLRVRKCSIPLSDGAPLRLSHPSSLPPPEFPPPPREGPSHRFFWMFPPFTGNSLALFPHVQSSKLFIHPPPLITLSPVVAPLCYYIAPQEWLTNSSFLHFQWSLSFSKFFCRGNPTPPD